MSVFKNKITWVAGLSIFSMFFGAGNVVFPLTLGTFSGDKILFATAGLMLSSICGPLLGLIAVLLFDGNCKQFFNRVGKITGPLLMLLALCLLGPFAVMPRCYLVAYEALISFFPNLTLLKFSIITSLLVIISIAKREWLFKVLGYILSPTLIFILSVIIYQGVISDGELVNNTITISTAFKEGLLVGYDTMDLMAALFFGAPIGILIKKELNHSVNKNSSFTISIAASLLGGSLLGAIYLGLSWVSAKQISLLEGIPSQSILTQLSKSLLGAPWYYISNFAIALACITTVMSLTVMITELIKQNKNFNVKLERFKFNYQIQIIILMIITIIFTNLGFEKLMSIIHPLIKFFYPSIIVITVCNILYKLFGFKYIKVPFWMTVFLTFYLS